MANNKSAPVKSEPVDKKQASAAAGRRKNSAVDWDSLLVELDGEKDVLECSGDCNVFRQGDPADSVFFLRSGNVRLSVLSRQGKEAIVGVMSAGDFFGEGCLAGQPLRISTADTLTDCTLMKIGKQPMTQMLQEKHNISELFVKHLLSRYIRFEGDLIDQLFNSSEKRLARTLLLLSHFGQESKIAPILLNVNQEHLSQMVGTTRPRISHFMNKFRGLGFVDYDKTGQVTVHSSLLTVLLHD